MHKQIIKTRGILKYLVKNIVYRMPPPLFCKLFLTGAYDIEVAYLEGYPTKIIANQKTNHAKIAFVHCDFSVSYPVKALYKSKKECLEEYKKFSKVCFVSNSAFRGFENVIGKLENAKVVHNVLDFRCIYQKAKDICPLQYQTNGCKMITIGRLSAPKGYDRLLRIIKELEKTFEFELWILGEGELRKQLQQTIIDENIRSIKLLGFQKNPYCYLKQADIFVCSSYYEGYSTAVTEAIALGVPVVTTKCAGMSEILDDGKYGMIVENSEGELKQKLAHLLANPPLISQMKKDVQLRAKQLPRST